MKRCPQCNRTYADETLNFCLEDGEWLLNGDEPATAIKSVPPASAGGFLLEPGAITARPYESESSTRVFQNTTDQTVILRTSSEAEPQSSLDALSEEGSVSAHPAAKPTGRFSGRKQLLAALGLIIFVLVAGFFGYRYFAASNSKQISSIAIMPFANESGNTDVDYLSDGMTETLISSVSQLPDLNVKPRSLVFRYKGKDADPQTIGKDLGVQAVFNGRVASRGDDLSLYVELIDAASTKVLWSRQYNRKQGDIVSLQSDIARDLSNTLRPKLSTDDEKKVTREYTANPEAYKLLLLGNSLRARRKLVDVQKAVECYEQAIALDPNYALAYTGLAGAHVFMTIYGGAPGGEEFPKARAAAEKALEIEPNLPAAISTLAIISIFYDHDFTAFERQQNKAVELSPNNGEFHRQIGIRLAWLGRFDEAVAEFKRSLDLEPMSAVTHVNLGWTYYFAGKMTESDAELAMALEMDPTLWFTHYQMFINAMTKGESSTAVEHLAKAHELRDEPDSAKFMRDAFARGGWHGFVQAVVDEPEKSKLQAYPRATLAMELGDKEKAFAALNEDYAKYDQFIYFLKVDPKMQPLRNDPRYDELLKKLGFPQ